MTPGRRWAGHELHGFFGHLEHDANTGRDELRFVLDVDDLKLIVPLALNLGHGGIPEALAAAAEEARRQMRVHRIDAEIELEHAEREAPLLEPLVSTLLYLCAEASEIHERVIEGAGRPHPRKPPQRWPKAPTTWDVGVRLGAALREAERAGRESPEGVGGGTHARPRAHVRRAHWHTYLTGSGRSTPVLKWLPPIPVNVDLGTIVPTIRRVE